MFLDNISVLLPLKSSFAFQSHQLNKKWVLSFDLDSEMNSLPFSDFIGETCFVESREHRWNHKLHVVYFSQLKKSSKASLFTAHDSQ